MLKQSKSWLMSDSGHCLLGILSWMTLIIFILGVTASSMIPTRGIYLGDSPFLHIVAWAIFAFFGLVVIGETFLWVSMIWFCARYYKGGAGKKVLSLMAQALFFSLASATLYFFIYRPGFKQRAIEKLTVP